MRLYPYTEDYPPSFSSCIRFQKIAVCLFVTVMCWINSLCREHFMYAYYYSRILFTKVNFACTTAHLKVNMQLLKVYRDPPVGSNFNEVTNVQEVQSHI